MPFDPLAGLEALVAAAQAAVDREARTQALRQAVTGCEREVRKREMAVQKAALADRTWLIAWREACSGCWLGVKAATLEGAEFIRRFLIHLLPAGFHRIRYFGFLGNCHRARKLERCRELLGMAPAAPTAPSADYRDRFEALTGRSLRQCPHCHTGIMVVIGCVTRPGVCQPVPDTS